MNLPDIFETRQGEALRQAYVQEDIDRYRAIEQHVLAESATTPEEREELKRTLRGAVLFQEMFAAEAAGDEERAERFRSRIKKECSPRTIKQQLAAASLTAGLREGLTREQHEQLTGWVTELELGEEIHGLVRSIKVH